MGDSKNKEKVSLKLLVNKETNKVLFAEAGKDFVDALFSFLTLPLGTIARLVQKDSKIGPVTIGCLNTLYQSVADLDKEVLWTEESRGLLLQPKSSSEHYCNTLKLNIDDTQPTAYFVCTNLETCIYRYFTTSINRNCACGVSMTRSISLEPFHKGFVNDFATFVVTDNLNVIPTASHYTSLDLVQNSGIKSMSSLKEMTVNVTKEKVLDLLKCSLLSKTPLTDIFVTKMKPSLERSLFLPSVYIHCSNFQITLNLVIRKSDKKILYAQGDQDFVDLLLSFLTFPLGALRCILGENSSLGSIDTLYNSIVNLEENKFLLSKEAKNRLVSPHGYLQFRSMKLGLSRPEDTGRYYCYYPQVSCKQSINNDPCFISEEFSRDVKKSREVKLVYTESDTASRKGFVKGPAMYLVTDDLILAPSSPISALHLINRLETPLTDVKEKVVTVGIQDCLNILKASLISTSALTIGLSHLLTDVKEEK